jgi:hypothetical protein
MPSVATQGRPAGGIPTGWAQGRKLPLVLGMVLGFVLLAGDAGRIRQGAWWLGTVLQLALACNFIALSVLAFRLGGEHKGVVLGAGFLGTLFFGWLAAVFWEAGNTPGFLLSGIGIAVGISSSILFWRAAKRGKGRVLRDPA